MIDSDPRRTEFCRRSYSASMESWMQQKCRAVIRFESSIWNPAMFVKSLASIKTIVIWHEAGLALCQETVADELEEAYRSGVWLPERGRLSNFHGIQGARVNLLTFANEMKVSMWCFCGPNMQSIRVQIPCIHQPALMITSSCRACLPCLLMLRLSTSQKTTQHSHGCPGAQAAAFS